MTESVESGRDEAQEPVSEDETITEITEIETTEDGQTVITTTTVITDNNGASQSTAHNRTPGSRNTISETLSDESASEDISEALNISGENKVDIVSKTGLISLKD